MTPTTSDIAVSAVIFGCSGLRMTAEEGDFYRRVKPLGFILFARNCADPDQVRALVAELKAAAGHGRVLILIDQEGGRVARLKPPHWRSAPPAGKFAAQAMQDMRDGGTLEQARAAVYMNARLIARELHEVGINVNCAPLADVPAPGSHDIIGDRAYGADPDLVSILGAEMARGLTDGGVLPVLKHIPGHGRARADSHETLPEVAASLEEMTASDFVPFKRLAHLPLGMTAHILFKSLDSDHVATLSPRIIRMIREDIGFDGLLMCDDLSMKALNGGMTELAAGALAAGCDVVLHCNGNMNEMQLVAKGLAPLDAEGRRRFDAAWAMLRRPDAFDAALAQSEVDGYLGIRAA